MTTTFDPIARLREMIGVKREPTAWRTVTQADIDAFAQVSGDHYWIHTDVERARLHPHHKKWQNRKQALPGCQREQPNITLQELEQMAATPLGIQC